jgi:hypothetical protein
MKSQLYHGLGKGFNWWSSSLTCVLTLSRRDAFFAVISHTVLACIEDSPRKNGYPHGIDPYTPVVSISKTVGIDHIDNYYRTPDSEYLDVFDLPCIPCGSPLKVNSPVLFR